MEPIRLVRHSRILYFFLLTGAGALTGLPAQAQESRKDVRMQVQPSKEVAGLNPVALRPNTTTRQSLFFIPDKNESPPIKLVVVNDDGTETPLADATLDDFASKDIRRLLFKKDKAAPDKIVVKGPPFKVQLKVGKTTYHDVKVEVREPKEFVEVTFAGYEREKSKLHFIVKLNRDATGPQECPVQLVLGPEFEESKQGVLQNLLTEATREVDLFAENVKFRDSLIEGTVRIKVDGYERAFNYLADLKGNPRRLDTDNVAASVRIPQYVVPSEKVSLRLELNGSLHTNHLVEIGLDRVGSRKQFQVLKTYAGLRNQQVELSFAKEGDLLWKTTVQDWQDDFNIAGVFNPVWFKVGVQVKKGPEATDVPVEIADGVRPSKDLILESTALYMRVILDPTPPQNVRFVKLSSEAERGKVLRVRAAADGRDRDRQAPIDKVVFFYGKAAPDGKMGPEAARVDGQLDAKDPSNATYFADIVLPDKQDSLDLSVQFTTKTGLAAAAKTETIRLLAPAASAKSFKISGVVRHGDSPEPDLKVGLFEAKGLSLKKDVSTNAKGEFVFENVEPGSYIISAGTNYPKTAGQADVVVSSKDEKVDVNLRAK